MPDVVIILFFPLIIFHTAEVMTYFFESKPIMKGGLEPLHNKNKHGIDFCETDGENLAIGESTHRYKTHAMTFKPKLWTYVTASPTEGDKVEEYNVGCTNRL